MKQITKLNHALWTIAMMPKIIVCGIIADNASPKAKKKEEQKEIKAEMKAAKKAMSADRKEDFSPSVEKNIQELLDTDASIEREIKRVELCKKAVDTNGLINYALYYTTFRKAGKINLPEQEKEIVNAISELIGFGKVYEESFSTNLAKYDPEYPDYIPSAKYLLSIRDILARKNDPAFMQKMVDKRDNVEPESNSTASKIVDPIEFITNNKWVKNESGTGYHYNIDAVLKGNSGTVINENSNIAKDEKQHLESVFHTGLEHEFFRSVDGKLKLTVTDEKGSRTFDIDDGIYEGEGIYSIIYCFYDSDTKQYRVIWIPESAQSAINKLLSSTTVELSDDDIKEVVTKYMMFSNPMAYHYCDISLDPNIRIMPKPERDKLSNNIVAIANGFAKNLAANFGMNGSPKLRMSGYNGPDNFQMVSDQGCMIISGFGAQQILDGLVINFSMGKIEYWFQNQFVALLVVNTIDDVRFAIQQPVMQQDPNMIMQQQMMQQPQMNMFNQQQPGMFEQLQTGPIFNTIRNMIGQPQFFAQQPFFNGGVSEIIR